VLDAVKSYLQMASGIAEAGAAKAMETAQDLFTQGLPDISSAPEQLAEQVQLIADDLMEQSRTNRELIVGLLRTEVERAVGRIGFVREEELAAVRAHVDRLEQQLRDAAGKIGDLPGLSTMTEMAEQAAEDAAQLAAAVSSEARAALTLAESIAERDLGVEHTPTEDHDRPAKKTVVRTPAKKAAVKKAPAAKKSTAKKAPAAKKSTAKKAPAAKKSTAKKTSATNE
jgi:polyhydroxyalkanoate synthesis regulator phasin